VVTVEPLTDDRLLAVEGEDGVGREVLDGDLDVQRLRQVRRQPRP
jgi:hypothetical protein